MTYVNKFGEQLRKLRGVRTLYEVAYELGMNRTQLKRYEEGRIPENDSIIRKLANFYGLSYRELKSFCFEDLYPENTEVRDALFWWVKSRI